MQTESREPRAAHGPRLERAIVLQLLRDDHAPRWSRRALLVELDADMARIEAALIRLNGDGVLRVAAEEVWATRAVRTLDELGLIGI